MTARRRHWTAALCGALLGCSANSGLPVTTTSADARRAFEDGLVAFDHLKMAQARSAFERASQADPEFGLAHTYLALAMNSTGDVKGRLEKARRLAARASEAEQRAIEAGLAWAARDHERAIERLDALLSLAPRSRQAWFERGVHHYERRRYAEAASDLEKAVQIDPGFVAARLFLARALARQGDGTRALAAVAEARRLGPQEPLAWFVAGEVHLQGGAIEPALDAFGRAIALDAGFVPAYDRRGYSHRVRDDLDAARRDYEAAFARAAALPDGAYKDLLLDWQKAEDLAFELAVIHLFAGDDERAIAAAREAAAYCERVRPANAVVYHHALGRILLESGRLEEALEAYQRGEASIRQRELPARERTLWHGRLVHARGRIHARAGRFREALAEADELLRMIEAAGAEGEPYREALHYLLGYIHLERRSYDQALAELERADGEDPFVQWLLARAHRGRGDEARANALVAALRAKKGGGFRHALVRGDVLAWPAS